MDHETDASPEIHPEVASLASVEPARAQPTSTLRKIFWCQDGVRAGWSLLIFIAIFAGLTFCINLTLRKLGVPKPDPSADLSPLFGIIVEGGSFLLLVVVAWIMSKIERRSFAVYGMGDRRKLAHFLAGMVWGIVALSTLILLSGWLDSGVDHRLFLARISFATQPSDCSSFF
jgi:hypothetical protein